MAIIIQRRSISTELVGLHRGNSIVYFTAQYSEDNNDIPDHENFLLDVKKILFSRQNCSKLVIPGP